jgi:serine/threonine protein kinase
MFLRSEDNVGVDDEFEELELPELKTVATLGVGGFGRVNLVRQFDSERVYALKILNKRHVKDMNQASVMVAFGTFFCEINY